MSPQAREGEAQHYLIVGRAKEKKISGRDVGIGHGRLATILNFNDHEELIVQGVPQSWLNDRAVRICDDKKLTKELFAELDIPAPNSHEFHTPDEITSLQVFGSGTQFVCKPAIGTNGVGVDLRIFSLGDVHNYLERYGHLGTSFLLEELHPGYDLRIQVIGSRIVAACVREPAHVLGDGKSTLTELIKQRRGIVRRQNAANDLVLDDDGFTLLHEQGFNVADIVPDGHKVVLKNVSNMAQGGHAIDVTDEIHPVYGKWVDRLSRKLNAPYFALDVMCNDHVTYPGGNPQALELNIRAEWMHHTFSERRTHDLASIVIRELFPEA